MYLFTLLLVICLIVPLYYSFKNRANGKKAKNAVIANLVFFAAFALTTVTVCLNNAMAAEAKDVSSAVGLGFIAAALVTGLSCIGAGIAVASAASSALGAISENETIFGKSLIFVALAEGVALYGLLISIQILNKLPVIV